MFVFKMGQRHLFGIKCLNVVKKNTFKVNTSICKDAVKSWTAMQSLLRTIMIPTIRLVNALNKQ